jgi:hypothetical protein
MGDGPAALAFTREQTAEAKRDQPAAPPQPQHQQQQQQQRQEKKVSFKNVRGAAATAKATAGARSS